MKLSEWVRKEGGAVPVALKLGTTPHAVRYWLKGIFTPRPKTMLQIVALSKGKVSLAEIVIETTRKRVEQ